MAPMVNGLKLLFAAILPLIETLREPDRWSSIRIADILATMGRQVPRELELAWPTLSVGSLAMGGTFFVASMATSNLLLLTRRIDFAAAQVTGDRAYD